MEEEKAERTCDTERRSSDAQVEVVTEITSFFLASGLTLASGQRGSPTAGVSDSRDRVQCELKRRI